MGTIIWERPSGSTIELNDQPGTIQNAIDLGFKRAKGSTEDQIKKEMEEEAELQNLLDEEEKVKKQMDAAASSTATFDENKRIEYKRKNPKTGKWEDPPKNDEANITPPEIEALLGKK